MYVNYFEILDYILNAPNQYLIADGRLYSNYIRIFFK